MPDTSWFDSALTSKDSSSSNGGNWFDKALGKDPSLPPMDLKSQADKNMSDAEVTTPQSLSQRYVAPFVRPGGQLAGSIIGEMAAAPLAPFTAGTSEIGGAIGGGMLGDLAGQGLQQAFPDYLGEPPKDLKSSLSQALRQSAEMKAGGMVASGGFKIGSGVANNSIPLESPFNLRSKVVKQTLEDQTANRNRIDLAQDNAISSEGAAHDALVDQAGKDLQFAGKTPNTLQSAELNASNNVAQAKYDFQASEKKMNSMADLQPSKYYREVKPDVGDELEDSGILDASGKMMKKEAPPPTFDKIRAPIPLDNTQAVASSISNKLSKASGASTASDSLLNNIRGYLKDIVNEEPSFNKTGDIQGPPVWEYNRLDRLNKDLTNYLSSHPGGTKAAPDPTVDALKQLNLNVTQDLDAGLQQWGQSNNAYNQFHDMMDKYIDYSNKANPKLAQNLLAEGNSPPLVYNIVSKKALSSPEAAEDFINHTNDRPSLARMAWQQIGENSIDSVSNEFNPKAAIKEMMSNPVYKTAIPSQAYSNTLELYKRLAQNDVYKTDLPSIDTSPSVSNSGFAKYARGIQVFHGYGLGMGIAGSLLYHSGIPATAILGTKFVLKGIGYSMDKLMLNPTTARAMIQAASTPASSPLMNTLGKVIVGGLRGVNNLEVQDEKGNNYHASVNSQGKIVLQ